VSFTKSSRTLSLSKDTAFVGEGIHRKALRRAAEGEPPACLEWMLIAVGGRGVSLFGATSLTAKVLKQIQKGVSLSSASTKRHL